MVAMFWLKPTPRAKINPKGVVRRNTPFRPYVSDRGAARQGPSAWPITYSVRGSVATTFEMWKSSARLSIAGAKEETPTVLCDNQLVQ